jgi:spermidine/putrescine transport system substrate-binding protein
MISAFAKYANGVKGSEAFLPDELKNAPEIIIPAAFVDKGAVRLNCPPEVQDIYTAIWTELQK